MSVANSHAVRRNPASTMPGAPAQRPAARPGPGPATRIGFAPQESQDEGGFKLNLSDLDIPRARDQLEVEGFKPSFLSRLLDLISR